VCRINYGGQNAGPKCIMVEAKAGISGRHQLNSDVFSAMIVPSELYDVTSYGVSCPSQLRCIDDDDDGGDADELVSVAQQCGKSSGWSCLSWLTEKLRGNLLIDEARGNRYCCLVCVTSLDEWMKVAKFQIILN
jgi:hypothetical protein